MHTYTPKASELLRSKQEFMWTFVLLTTPNEMPQIVIKNVKAEPLTIEDMQNTYAAMVEADGNRFEFQRVIARIADDFTVAVMRD